MKRKDLFEMCSGCNGHGFIDGGLCDQCEGTGKFYKYWLDYEVMTERRHYEKKNT